MTKKWPRVVLASTSPYRSALLERLGVPFEQRDPTCSEEEYRDLPPDRMATELALLKARSVVSRGEDALIIGSDQVVEIDGETLGKPGTAARAVAQLLRLQGRTHRLITAVAVIDVAAQAVAQAVDVHELTMHPWPEGVLRDYVDHDQPLGCAGAYFLEKRGIALFSHIRADPDQADDTAVIGLPLMKTLACIRELGYEILRA